jgi:hypothetical protein
MQCVAKSVKPRVSKKKLSVLWLVKYLEEVEEEEDCILERFHKRKPIVGFEVFTNWCDVFMSGKRRSVEKFGRKPFAR